MHTVLKWIIGSVVLLIICTIFLFLWNEFPLDSTEKINETKFGTFGDFIGGLLGGLTFVLVVYSIILQQETNKSARESYAITNLTYLLDSLNKEIELFNSTPIPINLSVQREDNKLDSFNYILNIYNDSIVFLKANKDIDWKLKHLYLNKFQFLFYSKILWKTNDEIVKNTYSYINHHDDTQLFIPRYATLAIDCLKYLSDRRLIKQSKWKEETLLSLETLIRTYDELVPKEPGKEDY